MLTFELQIDIVPLDGSNVGAAASLIREVLPKHAATLTTIGEGPEECYTHALNKNSDDPEKVLRAAAWAKQNGINLSRLQYFLAMDQGRFVGVSGIYSTLPGYLERQGTDNPERAIIIQTNDHFWMGWTAVLPAIKGRGIGTILMKHGMRLALNISDQEQIAEPYWTVLADGGATGFYDRRGLTRFMPHGSETIYVNPLRDVFAVLAKHPG